MFNFYKKIIGTVTGQPKKKQSIKTKKPKAMKLKKLSPEQKAKVQAAIKKAAGAVEKYGSGKPKVKVTPAPKTQGKQPATNFWTDKIDMGFIKPTGTQLVVGTSILLVGGAVAYKAFK